MFLAPGQQPERVREFIGYCLAYAANKYDIQVHAAVMMSNHYHIDLTDPHGQLVAFKQLFNSLLARGINAMRGRFDKFWSADPACDTRRPDDDDESFGDLVYTITNPVKGGLVKWSRQWPGFSTAGWRFGDTRSFRRPEQFFDAKGDMPEAVSMTLVSMTLVRPHIYRELDDDALYERFVAALRQAEERIQAQMRSEGRRFMGLRKLAKQGWRQVAQSFEERFGVRPKVAASSKWLRLAQLQRDRQWEAAYAAARELWLAGKRAVFPPGTYWLRRFARVRVASSG